ncbi:Autophagy-related protein 13 [Grifola frondosa]|uniref:Autophagy-related protein 13 n=1 Tax=Grifola frondosa TaxID=5627 RepID=A0A1C7MKG9_GRIFR|nr:Autophagy-related protein 13 [Grifola frondosa]
MSNDESQKADQIAHRLYTKLILVVNHARATAEPSEDAKIDHWFNLDIPDPDIFRRHTRIYRSISTTHYVPVFQLQVLLCVPELTNNQYILLETWDLVFTPAHTQQEVFAATMYKHSLTLFRSIFTMLRILPSWKLARRLRRRGAGGRGGNFSIELHVQGPEEGGETVEGILGFGMPPAPTAPAFSTDSHSFPKITHATGCFAFSATYLTSPNFQLESLESVLSSRFLSLDEGPDFTPTLVKNQQRDSISGSPGSLPVRTSLPRLPPRSIADRFVLPPAVHTRTTSLPGLGGSSPRGMQPVALPGARRPSNAGIGTAGSTSGMSDGSSSRQGAGSTSSRDDAVSTLAARLRRESMGAGRGYDGPSPGPVPIRQQALSTVNPFKSSTLSSGSPSLHSASHSLRQHSPLSSAGGPSLPARPAHTSPTSSRLPVPPSPIGIGSKMPSSPVTPLRPSPHLRHQV